MPAAEAVLSMRNELLGVLPEQRQILRHDPADLPSVPIPADVAPPPTVSPREEKPPQTPLELNAAIREALNNADVDPRAHRRRGDQ